MESILDIKIIEGSVYVSGADNGRTVLQVFPPRSTHESATPALDLPATHSPETPATVDVSGAAPVTTVIVYVRARWLRTALVCNFVADFFTYVCNWCVYRSAVVKDQR
jgi:hypothetical protein